VQRAMLKLCKVTRNTSGEVGIMTAHGRIIPEHKMKATVRTNRSARIVSVITLVFVSLLLSSLSLLDAVRAWPQLLR
jgi:hypothetical protein